MQILKEVFLNIFNMGSQASLVILIVMFVRLLMKKAPKKFAYGLWGIVGFRLICPVSFSSAFSIFNIKYLRRDSVSTISNYASVMYNTENVYETVANNADYITVDTLMTETPDIVGKSIDITTLFSMIWVVGILTLIIYIIASYIKVSKSVKTAVRLYDNVYTHIEITMPFVLGFVHPKIYLPLGLRGKEEEYILRHERFHIKRHDNIIKPFAFMLLIVYWMNPLMWLGYFLLCKDMEMSCDEGVLSAMGTDIKKSYSMSLLSLAEKRSFVGPLAFSESNVKGRIKNVLKFKKQKTFALVLSVILCAVVGVACMTNAKENDEALDTIKLDAKLNDAVSNAIIEKNYTDKEEGEFIVEAHTVLGFTEKDEKTTVYAMTLYESYDFVYEEVTKRTSNEKTVVMVFKKDQNGNYTVLNYWTPLAPNRYEAAINQRFPEDLREEALDKEKYKQKHQEICKKQATAYFSCPKGIKEVLSGTDKLIANPSLYLADTEAKTADRFYGELLNRVKEVKELLLKDGIKFNVSMDNQIVAIDYEYIKYVANKEKLAVELNHTLDNITPMMEDLILNMQSVFPNSISKVVVNYRNKHNYTFASKEYQLSNDGIFTVSNQIKNYEAISSSINRMIRFMKKNDKDNLSSEVKEILCKRGEEKDKHILEEFYQKAKNGEDASIIIYDDIEYKGEKSHVSYYISHKDNRFYSLHIIGDMEYYYGLEFSYIVKENIDGKTVYALSRADQPVSDSIDYLNSKGYKYSIEDALNLYIYILTFSK